jgi:hypothetical protein
MSYDISIWVPARPACAHCDRGPDDETCAGRWDPTWNLGPMLRAAGFEPGSDSPLHGRPATEWAAVLRGAIERMEAEPERFRAMNPENGWGSYDGILPVLREMLEVCERYPHAIGWTR